MGSWRQARWHLAGALLLAVALLVAFKIQSVRAQTKTFTGCLTTNGAVYRVAIGTAPTKPCGATDTQISWTDTGPEGPPGPTGSPGTIGVEGTDCGSAQAVSGFGSSQETCGTP